MQQARKSKRDLESPTTSGQIECTGHGILLSRAISSEGIEVDCLRVKLIPLPVLEGAYNSHEILEFFLLSELSGRGSTPSTNRNMLGV